MELEFGSDFSDKFIRVIECCDYFAWHFGEVCGKSVEIENKYGFEGDKSWVWDSEWRDVHVNM